ncbi:hypothetical protein FBQ99_06645 [Chloroflexi bacterium CFX2]|nr:hypothetical protein [Chloroflexi bacterium CFX2]
MNKYLLHGLYGLLGVIMISALAFKIKMQPRLGKVRLEVVPITFAAISIDPKRDAPLCLA